MTHIERDLQGRVLKETAVLLSTQDNNTHELSKAYAYDATGKVVVSAQADAGVNPEDCFGLAGSNDSCRVTYNRYDGFGYLVETIDPKGQVTHYSRDGQGNPTAVYEKEVMTGNGLPENVIVNTAVYDGQGNAIARSDSQGNTTRYDYNGFGETITIGYPNGYTKRFDRNQEGAITGIMHRMNNKVLAGLTMELNAQNQPLSVYDDGELSQMFQYDGMGNVVLAIDYNLGLGHLAKDDRKVVVERRFDSLGNMVSEAIDGKETMADFDRNRLIGTDSPSGIATDMEYDHIVKYIGINYASNLLSRLTSTGLDTPTSVAPKLTADYNWLGTHVSSLTRSAGSGRIETNRGLNDFGNLDWMDVRYTNGQSNPNTSGEHIVDADYIASFTYDYNKNHRLTKESSDPELVAGGYGDISYELDALDRVVGYKDQQAKYDYELDDANNIVSVGKKEPSANQPEVTDFTTGDSGLNELTAMSSTTKETSFEYDDRGNMTYAYNAIGRDWSEKALVWDHIGRLAGFYRLENQAGSPTLKSFDYLYDAFNRRVGKNLNQANSTLVASDEVAIAQGGADQLSDLVEDNRSKFPRYDTVAFYLYGGDVLEEVHTTGRMPRITNRDDHRRSPRPDRC